jgi:hypothetical protein
VRAREGSSDVVDAGFSRHTAGNHDLPGLQAPGGQLRPLPGPKTAEKGG